MPTNEEDPMQTARELLKAAREGVEVAEKHLDDLDFHLAHAAASEAWGSLDESMALLAAMAEAARAIYAAQNESVADDSRSEEP
jgi:hypothetical protein